MKHPFKLAAAFLLALAVVDLSNIDTADARGGGPNASNWSGYQRRLKESREQLGQSYTTPPSAYPGKKWKNRGKRK